MENERIIISVIIPAFNEVDNIGECIERLLIEISKITHEYEVIIVNDGSTDETGKLITKISKKNKKIRTTGYEKNKGKGFAVREKLQIMDGKNRVVKVIIPKDYSGKIMVNYVEPMSWKTAEIVSLITIGAVVYGCIYFKKSRKGKKA